MPCTAQLGGSECLWMGSVYPLWPGDTFPMITDQHTAGGSVSQLSQLTKLSRFPQKTLLHHSDITRNDFGFHLIKSWVNIISPIQYNQGGWGCWWELLAGLVSSWINTQNNVWCLEAYEKKALPRVPPSPTVTNPCNCTINPYTHVAGSWKISPMPTGLIALTKPGTPHTIYRNN